MTTLAARQGLDLVRWVLATLLFIHGLARVLAGGVAPFGAFLDAQGFPAGLVLAWAVTSMRNCSNKVRRSSLSPLVSAILAKSSR